MSTYENKNYNVVIDYVIDSEGKQAPYKSYLIVNKNTDVIEATHTVFAYARDMADDFNDALEAGSRYDRDEQAPVIEAPELNS
ncbi:hypothetical protein LCGC14_2746400 [marine sediment metagenome]|uniref:Uncharacterized protein n=1 Tax=marine sediment metagenome TaxID=412755 RepID=A0A0F8Z341_9ZZZZ